MATRPRRAAAKKETFIISLFVRRFGLCKLQLDQKLSWFKLLTKRLIKSIYKILIFHNQNLHGVLGFWGFGVLGLRFCFYDTGYGIRV